ncbi:MAPEG family protein [Pseudomonas lalucatii]|uniref:MAPEG family protein n=1 Tax=Pseudomonas lalucatii TaxID=1424203 RepID=A0ABS5PW51_9PSED|nr:MAPEG family protein [Pseudomonas lalucatii]MBS7691393.1 MAPEG family protein [Pseudomonas lalucatii]MBS7724487.1 MAPEG family protein [Pseudomonas lalucatii]QVM87515.1 MAPEG family protein [Pseudomonas lalucatii]
MSLPFWCIFISALLIFLAKAPVAKAMQEEGGRYDNRHPRSQQARLRGFGARALAAHLNSFEAFPLFVAGVLMAHVSGAQGLLVDALAVTFVVSRVLYLLCYWADLHWQRSLVWAVGLLCSLALMLTPAL